MVKLDIWNNLTYFQSKDIWFKQTFFENELLEYEDSNGNYWNLEFGAFPFSKIKFFLLDSSWIDSPIYHPILKYVDDKLEITLTSSILGINPNSFIDTGYVWAPYIPLILEPTIHDDTITALGMALMTSKYEKKSINHRFYGKIRVPNSEIQLIV